MASVTTTPSKQALDEDTTSPGAHPERCPQVRVVTVEPPAPDVLALDLLWRHARAHRRVDVICRCLRAGRRWSTGAIVEAVRERDVYCDLAEDAELRGIVAEVRERQADIERVAAHRRLGLALVEEQRQAEADAAATWAMSDEEARAELIADGVDVEAFEARAQAMVDGIIGAQIERHRAELFAADEDAREARRAGDRAAVERHEGRATMLRATIKALLAAWGRAW